ILEGDLGEVVLHLLDHLPVPRHRELARLAVDVGADVEFRAVAAFRGLAEAVLHRLDHEIGVDHLLARDRIGDLQKFQPVGRGHAHFTSSSSFAAASFSAASAPLSAGWPGSVPCAFRPARLSAISSSVSTSLASESQSNRRPIVPSGISISTSSSSTPWSTPLNRRRPSISSVVSSRAS